jgi:prepilin-type N-terminal cleavage/methylation domain-containing protein
MTKNKHGFTIVELTVVVVIIAILAAISIVVYSKVQVTARDSDRAAKVKAIAESLENYYNKNGEYPGCTAMTQSGSTVSSGVLGGISSSILLAPKSASGTTNSITCTSVTSGSTTDAFGYVGDGSATCNTGAACLQFTLQYLEEGTGNVITLVSRHQVQIASAGAPTITAQVASNTQMNISWTTVSGATSYKLQRATNTGFTTGLIETSNSGSTASATGLAPGATYYFRIAAISGVTQGAWSNTATATTTIDPPTSTPVVTAGMSGTNAVGTSGAVACTSGTAQYQLRTRNTATATMGTWSAWSAWGTTLTLSAAASQGYQYGFQSQARCQGSGGGSVISALSNIATTVRAISTPIAPDYLSPSSFKSTVAAVVNYASVCPAGTSLYNANFTTLAWTGEAWGPHPFGFNDSWENTATTTKYVAYKARYQCKTTYATSPVSPDSSDSIGVKP